MTKEIINAEEAFSLLEKEFQQKGWLALEGAVVDRDALTITLPDSVELRRDMLVKCSSFLMFYGHETWTVRLTPGQCQMQVVRL